MEHAKWKTSAEVWAVIRAAHPELQVFSTYSAPDGDQFGDPSICRMMTEYGFPGADCSIIGAESTWDRNPDPSNYERLNEKHEYWICVGIAEE